MARKQRIFIGSSVESLPIAQALQRQMDHAHLVTIWSQDTFTPARNVFDSIAAAVRGHAYGVFIFGPDDVIETRHTKTMAPRLNVVLEAGYFAGVHGMHRTFILQPRGGKVRTLSDLAGITPVEFDLERFLSEPDAALGSAASSIARAIELDRLTYPAKRLNLNNLLSTSHNSIVATTIDEGEKNCLCVELGAGQSIRVDLVIEPIQQEIASEAHDFVTFRLSAHNSLWLLNAFNYTNVWRQSLIAEGPGMAVQSLRIGKAANKVRIDVYENDDDQPTWSKPLEVLRS